MGRDHEAFSDDWRDIYSDRNETELAAREYLDERAERIADYADGGVEKLPIPGGREIRKVIDYDRALMDARKKAGWQ